MQTRATIDSPIGGLTASPVCVAERVGLFAGLRLLIPRRRSGPPSLRSGVLRRCFASARRTLLGSNPRFVPHRNTYQILQLHQHLWRRGWDSNPRTRLGVTHFPGVRLRPLGHLSTRAARVPEAAPAIKSVQRVGLTRAILALALRARYARPKSLPAILSNPRTRLGVTHFPGVRLRPLGHLSTRAARVPEAAPAIKSAGAEPGRAIYPGVAALFAGAGL
ncbi:MAG: hypothetical protein QOI88_3475 [Gammaproteobacteria bacterium]|nr:hypothetical protein [Gammaproteobacteria bacterium]